MVIHHIHELIRTFHYCHHHQFSRASNMKILFFPSFLSITMHTGHTLQAIRHMNSSCHLLCQVLWSWGSALWPVVLNNTSCLSYNTVTTSSVQLSTKVICPQNTVLFHPFLQICVLFASPVLLYLQWCSTQTVKLS